MMENLLAEAVKHFNEPILMGLTIGRCIGYAEDDEDCYLIVRDRFGVAVRHTFVGGFTYLDCLKGKHIIISKESGEEWDDYYRIDKLLELNGCPKENTFIRKITG